MISDDTNAKSEHLECFEKKMQLDRDKEPTDEKIIDLFIKGGLIESEVFPSVIANSNYLIKRDDVDKYADFIGRGKNVIVTGSIASGKTIFIKQLVSLLCHQGRDVFYLMNEEGDYVRDASIISSISNNPIIVIDNAFRHEKTIEDLYAKFGERATYLLAGRADFIERTKISLKKLDFNCIELNLERLSINEISHLNKIISFIGYWGTNNSWSDRRKEEHLNYHCEGQISSILLELFKSEDIQARFNKELADLHPKNHSKVRQIVLLPTDPKNVYL